MAKLYRLIQETVEAMQHDGTTARAYEILAWVHRNGGSGQLKDTHSPLSLGELQIGYGDAPVADSAWVVRIANPKQKQFKIMDDIDFQTTYEQVPAMAQAGGGNGGTIIGGIGGAGR